MPLYARSMPRPNSLNRPIDRMREGGGQANIPVAFGNIVAMITTEHRLYLIAERGVSSGVFADQIDPKRQNAEIPQIVQREELTYGADTPFIQKTLCTAAALLNPTHLPADFPREEAWMLTLKIAQDAGAVAETVVELKKREIDTRSRMARGEITRHHLPSTPNLKGRTEQAIGQLRSIQISIIKLANFFYPKETSKAPWLDSVQAGFNKEDIFHEQLNIIVMILDEIAVCRNAMIHGDDTKSLHIHDYDLRADGAFIAPTLEVVHPQKPLSRRDIVQYIDSMKDRLVDVFAIFLSIFCDRNVRSISPMFETHVAELPDGELIAGSPFV